jgi:hypothetical protein
MNKLIGSAKTKEQLLIGAIKYFYGSAIVFHDDGSVSNAKGVLNFCRWSFKNGRYRLERI